MKEKILFVIPSLRSGGAEKSLITLLSLMDYEKFSVDLLSFRRDGLFFDKIPSEVNIIKGTEDYEMFDGDVKSATKYFIKKGKFISVINRLRYGRAYKIKDEDRREKFMWSMLKKQLPVCNGEYSCVVGYLEGNASFFAAEFKNVRKRICYVHSDFKRLGINRKLSEDAFKKCDTIVTVSQICADSLKELFPSANEKIVVIENIISPRLLNEYAEEEQVFLRSGQETVLLTVGRFAPPKGIDLAVRACALLKKKGYKVKWYHIGEGDLRQSIEALVSELDVREEFILLGERSNPYPYIGQCDIYVQPSRYEGKSIAIDEAKCLHKPIVTTNFTTVADQIADGVNGMICQMDENDIANKIELLIIDTELRKKLTDNLLREKTGNEEELEKFYALLN